MTLEKVRAETIRVGDVVPGHGRVDRVVRADHPPHFIRIYFLRDVAEFMPHDLVAVERRE